MNGIFETSHEWIGIIIFEEWQTLHCDNKIKSTIVWKIKKITIWPWMK